MGTNGDTARPLHILHTMRMFGLIALVTVLGSGCYREYASDSTMPTFVPEPVSVLGPPGGGMDPGYGNEPTAESAYPVESTNDSAETPQLPEDQSAVEQAPAEPSADPQDSGYVMGSVTDSEINQTLAPYGQWVETEDYGRVWRPNATVVGVDFTPYETCGSWIYTDYGWTFSCDWNWGWLPFHYGQWDWVLDSWCWIPDYTWSPAWVDWRSGGGYVGWRPQRPHIRDHRDHPHVRDRRDHNSHWRFSAQQDFGKPHIRSHTFKNPSEGLRLTTDVARPPIRHGASVTSAAQVMRDRLLTRPPRVSTNPHPYRPPHATHPSHQTQQPPYGPQPYRPPHAFQPPTHGTYQPPNRGAYQPPTRGTYQPPNHSYQPPSHGSYQPPSHGSYQPPSHGSSHTAPSSPPPSHSSPSPHSSSSSSSHSSSSSSSHSSSSSSSSSSSHGSHHK